MLSCSVTVAGGVGGILTPEGPAIGGREGVSKIL